MHTNDYQFIISAILKIYFQWLTMFKATTLHCKSFELLPPPTEVKEKWLLNLSCLSILICCQWALQPLFSTQLLSSPSTTVRTCDWLVAPRSHRRVNRIEIGRKMISVHLEGDKRVFFFSFISHWSPGSQQVASDQPTITSAPGDRCTRLARQRVCGAAEAEGCVWNSDQWIDYANADQMYWLTTMFSVWMVLTNHGALVTRGKMSRGER